MHESTRQRRVLVVRGRVQGVGFRPFVYSLATRLGLGGHVRNGGPGVFIEVEGTSEALRAFETALTEEAPPLSAIRDVTRRSEAPRSETSFRILTSDLTSRGAPEFPADAATCTACLRELFTPRDRRYAHPFITCTDCGPRLTIATGIPYDRTRTTMGDFPLCPACREEYEGPSNRRFHAEPIACPECGPVLRWLDGKGRLLDGDPLEQAALVLAEGGIVAVRGLGGFHLACDATDEPSVRRLRDRKQRDQKPFAVMVRNVEEALEMASLDENEVRELDSPIKPIVLTSRRANASLAPSVAPGLSSLGLLLPYTPVHHLLLARVRRPLVMTSANRSSEAIVTDETTAITRLAGIADAFLSHDRPIAVPCEDGVRRVVAGVPLLLRRSRGEAPNPLPLPASCGPTTLAVGGQFKAVFGLGIDERALLSPHFGDLDELTSFEAWQSAVRHFERLFDARPGRLVHDLHPDYASTRYAVERARQEGLECLGVQHHHAHMASCMAEHGLQGDVIGVCFDGVGLGLDGTAWGGEILVGGYRTFERAAHLAPFQLIGGDQAAREPWRVALSMLERCGLDAYVERWVPAPSRVARRTLSRLHERGTNCVTSTSVGRLFDAVAALVFGLSRQDYEGQAACRLEELAAACHDDVAYPFTIGSSSTVPKSRGTEFGSAKTNGAIVHEFSPGTMLEAVLHDLQCGAPREIVARRFHRGLASTVGDVCSTVANRTGLRRVVLSGGVFCNSVLTQMMIDGLHRMGFEVFRHRCVPPNDGGQAFGQLAIAAALGGDA